MKHTFVINLSHMNVGGIENYVAQILQLGLDENCRNIWLCDKACEVSPVYEKLMNDPRVERCHCDNHLVNWFRHEPLEFARDEKVVIFSFGFFDHARALQLKSERPQVRIIPLLLIPHFLGSDLYPEKAFQGLARTWVRKLAAGLYGQWLDDGILYAFSMRHLDTIEELYGITVENKQARIVPRLLDGIPFSEEEVIHRYQASEFTICSAGRLEFPHKGFVLGLLREFAQLKPSYPFLRLKIIGAGDGEAVLRQELSQMPADITGSVEICPPVSLAELNEEFKKAKLNISVAGCASAGAKVGLLTLPARHYCYECEVYGFFPESRSCTTESKPGEPVGPYIERVIHMSQEEYVDLSRKAYDTMNDKPADRGHFLGLDEAGKKSGLSKAQKWKLYAVLMAQRLLYKLKGLPE